MSRNSWNAIEKLTNYHSMTIVFGSVVCHYSEVIIIKDEKMSDETQISVSGDGGLIKGDLLTIAYYEYSKSIIARFLLFFGLRFSYFNKKVLSKYVVSDVYSDTTFTVDGVE